MLRQFIAGIVFATAFSAYADEHAACKAAVLNSLIDTQSAKLSLDVTDKAKFAVDVYGDLINDEGLAKEAEALCMKAYIVALPIPNPIGIGDE